MIRMLIFFPLFLLSACSRTKEEPCQVLDRAVVISLNRHLHRYEETKSLMEKAGFTNIRRFEAVDGFFTDDQFFESLNIYSGTPGQKGCAASHLLVWEDFLAHSDMDYLFVAEDDMLPHSDFADIFPRYWKLTPKPFDIVFVGNQMKCKSLRTFVLPKPSSCTHAYIISKEGARKLLDLYRLIPKDAVKRHVIDIFMFKLMNKKLINYYCYNGSLFKDLKNLENGNVFLGRDTGICFQNKKLGSSIHQKEIVFE